MKTKQSGALEEARELKLAACALGQAVAVVGNELRFAWNGGVDMPAARESYPLPPGRVVALGPGPSVLMVDGSLWVVHGGQLVKTLTLFGEVMS